MKFCIPCNWSDNFWMYVIPYHFVVVDLAFYISKSPQNHIDNLNQTLQKTSELNGRIMLLQVIKFWKKSSPELFGKLQSILVSLSKKKPSKTKILHFSQLTNFIS